MMKCVHLDRKAAVVVTGLLGVTVSVEVTGLRDVKVPAVVMGLQAVMVQAVVMDLQAVMVQAVVMDLRDVARVLMAAVRGDHQTPSDLLNMLCILMLTEMESSTRMN